MESCCKIRVLGIVQGVGFRPFIYNLAKSLGISGNVCNDTEGVLIHARAHAQSMDEFISLIREKAPPLARIHDIIVTDSQPCDFDGFSIIPSMHTDRRTVIIAPDTAVCDDCLEEFNDPGNFRHHYPFITCTNCGPRFSIISDIPYDRKNTSMAPFEMCGICAAEYHDPADRRFHTQPTACPACGPSLSLYNREHVLLSSDTDSIAARTVDLIREGAVVAIKGVGGYLIAADAANDRAVAELRKRKNRPFKPFALMAGSMDTIESFLHVSDTEAGLLSSAQRPIVLLGLKKNKVSGLVAPGLSRIGIMLPYMPFQHLLFASDPDLVLIMTSGNISDEPIAHEDSDAFSRLSRIADYFVTYDRDIVSHTDDSVMFCINSSSFFNRRSRGFVPVPFQSRPTAQTILATGGDLKNSFAIARDSIIILSQYLGDLETPRGHESFNRVLSHFRRVYDFTPDTVAADMHPGYFTTAIADEMEAEGLRCIRVQHHHAHIASVMEEHDLDGEVLGIAFDGTGYGIDSTLWGSEFLVCTRDSFRRAAHFSEFSLPGGERSIIDVWKIGVSLLHSRYGRSIPVMKKTPDTEMIMEIIEKKINSPLTCSIGRIFDGISAILGISESITCEAEAAMLLEEAANSSSSIDRAWTVPVTEGGTLKIRTEELVQYIADMVLAKRDTADIAMMFHRALASTAVSVAESLRDRYSLNRIALSGGVFQNRLLLSLVMDGLAEKGFDIFCPRRIPFNDGCIAVGQITVAKELLKS